MRRLGYGADGVESLHPLDAALNLPAEQYSFGLRRRAAEEAAKVSFEETVQSLAAQTGTVVGKRQVEQLVQRAAADFDAFYAQRQPVAPEQTSSVVVLTVDGKGVVMRPEDLRDATRHAAATRTPKLAERLSKGETPLPSNSRRSKSCFAAGENATAPRARWRPHIAGCSSIGWCSPWRSRTNR